LLHGCHTRIRHFMQLSRTLARAVEEPRTEIADAAASICRYFSKALPLHEADENESLCPRLRDALPQGGLVWEAAETMMEQHRAINELVVELLSLCTTLRHQPEHLPSLAHRLCTVTSALWLIFAAHLMLEETVIFPAIPQLLTPAQMEEVLAEMQARRHPQPGAIHLVH
jgi:iron-sulfur cluster repair protein YtfE (RIC family)